MFQNVRPSFLRQPNCPPLKIAQRYHQHRCVTRLEARDQKSEVSGQSCSQYLPDVLVPAQGNHLAQDGLHKARARCQHPLQFVLRVRERLDGQRGRGKRLGVLGDAVEPARLGMFAQHDQHIGVTNGQHLTARA